MTNFLFAYIDGGWHLCSTSHFTAPTEKNLEWLLQNAVGYLRGVAHKEVEPRRAKENKLTYYMRVMGRYPYKIQEAQTQARAMQELGIKKVYQI